MIRIKKYLENRDTTRGVITHEDQEVHGLRFRVVSHNKDWSAEQILVIGEEIEINAYITRNPTVREISRTELGTILNREWGNMPELVCDTCGGTGKVPNPFRIEEINKIRLEEEAKPLILPKTANYVILK